MNTKENALYNFIEMIKKSWTYAKMTEEEKKRLHQTFNNNQTKEALKGSYLQRWEILQAIYTSYLMALDYSWNWREDEKTTF